MAGLRVWLHALGWATVVPLVVVVVARFVAWDGHLALVAANAVLPVLLMPAWAVALLAAVLKRVPLVLVASGLVAAQLVVLAPDERGGRTFVSFARRASR